MLIAVTATAIGFAFDASSGNKELGLVFAAWYVVGLILAVLAVRLRLRVRAAHIDLPGGVRGELEFRFERPPRGPDRHLLAGLEVGLELGETLSIPGVYVDTKRRQHVVAKGFNEHGDPIQIVGDGLMARCAQHETDHLDGVLFVDRLDADRRKQAMKEIRAA